MNDRKIIDYTVVTDSDSYLISDIVKQHMMNGWVPFGGICCQFINYEEDSFYQARVKYKD